MLHLLDKDFKISPKYHIYMIDDLNIEINIYKY